MSKIHAVIGLSMIILYIILCNNIYCFAGDFRLGRYAPSPFGAGMMKNWHHVKCLFDAFKKAKATTKKIDDVEVCVFLLD